MNPASVSYWMQTAGPLDPRPALDTSIDVDVTILGAGFTGLWTAWYLLQREPSLRIAVCEAEVAGFGASGRNGAWCSAWIAVSPTALARRWNPETAVITMRAMRETVDEVGEVCAAQGIDAGYRKNGLLRLARGSHEVPGVRNAFRVMEHLGLDDGCALLDADELAQRVKVADARLALFDPNCATVHPGRLVRGLARLVAAAGVTIYEQTRVTEVHTEPTPRLETARGDVRAETVVLAGEAWLSQLGATRRAVLPLYSLIVLTEPLTDEQWATIGWEGGECMSSSRYTVDYLSRTEDGRILFGGRGAPYHFGSRIEPDYDRHGPTHAMLQRSLHEWFPRLGEVRFTHAWGGPLGMPRDWTPTFRYDPRTGLAGAYGYTGQGVATANLAGRTLADLITGTPSPLTALPMVNHRSRRWEVEPLRWLATRYMQRSLARLDAYGRRTGRPPTGRTLPERLFRH